MIRILFIILVIYIVVRLIRGPKKNRKPTFKFRFGDFEQGGFNRGQQKRSIEEIEEAEYEDITDTEKEKKEKSKP